MFMYTDIEKSPIADRAGTFCVVIDDLQRVERGMWNIMHRSSEGVWVAGNSVWIDIDVLKRPEYCMNFDGVDYLYSEMVACIRDSLML